MKWRHKKIAEESDRFGEVGLASYWSQPGIAEMQTQMLIVCQLGIDVIG